MLALATGNVRCNSGIQHANNTPKIATHRKIHLKQAVSQYSIAYFTVNRITVIPLQLMSMSMSISIALYRTVPPNAPMRSLY